MTRRPLLLLCCLMLLLLGAGAPTSAWERDMAPAPPGTPEGQTLHGWTHQRQWVPDLWLWRTILQGTLAVAGLGLDLTGGADLASGQQPGFTFTHCFPGRGALSLEGQRSDHNGLLKAPQTFRGRTYRTGSTVRIQTGWLEVAFRQVIALWNFADDEPMRIGYLEAIGGVQVHRLDLDMSGRDTLGAMAVGTWGEQEPFPFLGLAAGAAIRNRLLVRGFFKFLPVSLNYAQRSHDAAIDLAVHLHRRPGGVDWLAAVGYRNHQMDVSYGRESFSITRSGPVLHLMVRF